MSENILPTRLSYLRKAKNMTQEDMAKLLGITRPSYTAYEIGRRQPDYTTLKKIASIFNCSVDYLIGHNYNVLKEAVESTDEYQPNPKELENIIKEANLMFDGAPLDESDKEDILDFVRIAMRAIKKRKQHEEKTTEENQ